MADTNAPVVQAKKSKEYYIDEVTLYQNPTLFTVLDGKPLSLNGKEEKVKKPASDKYPERTIVYKAATQAELKKLFDAGHPLIKEREV
jgi:hypothetical protein